MTIECNFAILLYLGVANGTCVDIIWITPRLCPSLKERLMLSIFLIRWLGLEAVPRVGTDSHILRMAEQQERVWVTDTVEPPHHPILLMFTRFGDFCLWLFMCLFSFCLKSLEGFSKNIYFYLFIYLAMPSLSCSTQIFNLRAASSIFSCSLWGLNVEF